MLSFPLEWVLWRQSLSCQLLPPQHLEQCFVDRQHSALAALMIGPFSQHSDLSIFIPLLTYSILIYMYCEGKYNCINMRGKHWLYPGWGPNPQPRHVPCPGIKLATLHFVGQCPYNWATLVRAVQEYIKGIATMAKSTSEKSLRKAGWG